MQRCLSAWAGGLPQRLTCLTFGCGESAVVYECINFVSAHRGSEEAEFESSGTLPFRMSLIVQSSGTGSVHFEGACTVRTPAPFRNSCGALKVLCSSLEFELYDLEQAVTLLKPRFSGTLPAWFSGDESLIDDAVLVADFYDVELKMPEIPTHDDLESLALLKGLIDGLPLTVDDMTFTLTKCAHTTSPKPTTRMTRSSWARANPGLGIRITEDYIRKEMLSMSPAGRAGSAAGRVRDRAPGRGRLAA